MLKLKKICKIYKSGNFKQVALDKISIEFRKSEFVSILGPSGSGKTTLLNIIGGLDNYTSGNLIINYVPTENYKDRDWDAYRNHKIGFVFQSYHLIPHQSILTNVELALTLSGVGKTERKKRAKDALKKVGLEKHLSKRPNQLSGGQMQRVAIARALVNNPDILLADEPTGALDSKTSTQIMNLLQEVAKDRLVIMVTHNKELAESYSTRIIELKDGKILGDTNPYKDTENKEEKQKQNKTSMSFQTALSLSFHNLLTKKGRTILTAFAGSIGIIGIAAILSLSNGVQKYIESVQEEALTSYPITIDAQSVDLTKAMTEHVKKTEQKKTEKKEKNKIYSNNTIEDMMSIMSTEIKKNNLQNFKKYIEKSQSFKPYTSAITYGYNLNLQLYKNDTETIIQVHPDTVLETLGFKQPSSEMTNSMSVNITTNDIWMPMFENKFINNKLYQVVSGKMPTKYNEVALLVDKDEEISDYVLYALGLKDQKELENMIKKINNKEKVHPKIESYSYKDITNLSYKVLLNTDYYEKKGNIWIDQSENENYIKNKIQEAEEIKVVGIVKPSEEAKVTSSSLGGILYTKDLERHIIDKINQTEIVKEQKQNTDKNILTGLAFSDEKFKMENISEEQKAYLNSLSPEQLAQIINKYKEQANATYESTLEKLGAADLDKPSSIYIYAKNFKAKENIKDIIETYNEKQTEENKIHYNDLVGLLLSSVTSIVDMISYVLIGFVSISLIVSSIMIGIITYISVLERTKEIGILRAIGASKKDISRVFKAETLIIGLISGILGIAITILINIPINIIIKQITNVQSISKLPPVGAIFLVLISVLLTTIAGIIPARMASKKDPVESLRSE